MRTSKILHVVELRLKNQQVVNVITRSADKPRKQHSKPMYNYIQVNDIPVLIGEARQLVRDTRKIYFPEEFDHSNDCIKAYRLHDEKYPAVVRQFIAKHPDTVTTST